MWSDEAVESVNRMEPMKSERIKQAGAAPSRGGQQESKRARCIGEARHLLQLQKHGEALKALEPLLKKAKPDAETLFLAAMAHEGRHSLQSAVQFATRSLAQQEHPEPLLLIARIRSLQGETDKALACCDRAERLRPGDRTVRISRGSTLEAAGRFDEARAVVEPLVRELEAAGAEAGPMLRILWGKILIQFKEYDEAIRQLDMALADESLHQQGRADALYAKAKACDRKKDYDGAYAAARAANAIGELDFHPDLYEEQVSILIEHWSREKMERFPISSCTSEIPVFVAGMPRSGTSLIDQIIDAHPKAAGVGELATIDMFARRLAATWNPDLDPPESFGPYNSKKWTQVAEQYVREIRRLAPGAERIVNKSLGNNRLVGLIARLFPKTRIIHAIRDPRDVAVSCFMGGFNNALHPWTTRLEWVAAAWEQSMRMMEHWKRSLDVPILDVHYERLVNDPDTEFPRIIEFLGLEWDEACKEFHKSRRTVRTLSYDQVNRPLYTSSAGRNQNYARYMEGIRFPEYSPG